MATQLSKRKKHIIQCYLELGNSIETIEEELIIAINFLQDETANIILMSLDGKDFKKDIDINLLYEQCYESDIEFLTYVDENFDYSLKEKNIIL